MTLDLLILNKLQEYVDGDITLRQFYSWFANNTSQKESELIHHIKSILADFNSGHMGESRSNMCFLGNLNMNNEVKVEKKQKCNNCKSRFPEKNMKHGPDPFVRSIRRKA